MLFNSAGFIFVFLPMTLAALALAVWLRTPSIAIAVLIVASYSFYGWWQPGLVVLLAVSTIFNYAVGSLVMTAVRRKRIALIRILLWGGIGADLALLAYYKYADFFVGNVDAVTSLGLPLPMIALPVGISFYTFTQIAFLVDAAQGQIKSLRLSDYALFVSYFPHLVAGPIIHHRPTIPQFRRMASYGWDTTAIAVGLSIFAIGIFKKIALADNMAPFANAAFSHATRESLPFLDSWIGAGAYAFQIYFDFSGYSDMAVGLSLLFGVRLPINFASPYKATSIIEFWSRWHMSLSRFLRDYLYIPLGGNRRGKTRRYFNLMATMLLGGLWHGAGWTFVAWGALHGLYLIANHACRFAWGPPAPRARTEILWLKRLTVFAAVTVAWVLFRADTIGTAYNMLRGMGGGHGFAATSDHAASLRWLLTCLFIAWALPNTYQIFARFRPMLPPPPQLANPPVELLAWRMNAAVAVGLGGMLAACILAINRFSPFLYFRF